MVEIILNISFGITIVALLLAFIRMIIGPTVADRVVSLDVMTIISISIIVYIGSLAGRIIYLDVAMVYALISFLGVVAVARYLERGL
ncbi:MAG TPA: cation:proton antiporter [Candidatus Cloacimonetes bacterium]|nr:cation:proton antiporter [Candidatus Cloacimonadota bacterium]